MPVPHNYYSDPSDGHTSSLRSTSATKSTRQAAALNKNTYPCTNCQKIRKCCDKRSWDNPSPPCSLCKERGKTCKLRPRVSARATSADHELTFFMEDPGKQSQKSIGQRSKRNKRCKESLTSTISQTSQNSPLFASLSPSPITGGCEYTDNAEIYSSPPQLVSDLPSHQTETSSTKVVNPSYNYPASFSSMDAESPVSFMTGHNASVAMHSQENHVGPAFTYPFNRGQNGALPVAKSDPRSSSLYNWDGKQSTSASRSFSQPSMPTHRGGNGSPWINRTSQDCHTSPQAQAQDSSLQAELDELSACLFNEWLQSEKED